MPETAAALVLASAPKCLHKMRIYLDEEVKCPACGKEPANAYQCWDCGLGFCNSCNDSGNLNSNLGHPAHATDPSQKAPEAAAAELTCGKGPEDVFQCWDCSLGFCESGSGSGDLTSNLNHPAHTIGPSQNVPGKAAASTPAAPGPKCFHNMRVYLDEEVKCPACEKQPADVYQCWSCSSGFCNNCNGGGDLTLNLNHRAETIYRSQKDASLSTNVYAWRANIRGRRGKVSGMLGEAGGCISIPGLQLVFL